MNTTELTGLLISDFTIAPLADLLRADGVTPAIQARVAPFGQVAATLLDPDLEIWQSRPAVVVVWTQPGAVSPAFAGLLAYQPAALAQALAEVERFAGLIRGAAGRAGLVFVPTWSAPYYQRGWGMLDLKPGRGLAYALMQMNLRLAEALADCSNVYVLDSARWLQAAGKRAADPKLWLMGKIAFGPEVFKEASADIKAGWRGAAGLAKKLIVVDLDDTLWGGLVGEVGPEQLNLGGHNAVGEAFVQFQRGLKALTQRGILLAIASKNEEALALQAIDQHPEMVLRRQDFVGWRINWQDKAQNIADLAAELNLGLDSVVFIDDSPAERARVKAALPSVYVPDWPADKMHAPRALLELRCFDAPNITPEDARRTQLYRSEQEREALKQSLPSLADWLASLEVSVQVEELSASNAARAAQLLNKTNQMNLKTRRLTEAEFLAWARQPGQRTLVFRVADRFGDYGLTGLASLRAAGPTGHLEDFVLSCRVLGRGVEQAMLAALAQLGRNLELSELAAAYAPTPKNKPCAEFFNTASHFRPGPADSVYRWDLREPYPEPPHIQWTGLPRGRHEPSA